MSQMPDAYLDKLQNQYRKVISLNGSWGFQSHDAGIFRTVKVPSCYDFKGRAVYEREFRVDLHEIRDWSYVLCCDGINYDCDVSINGTMIVKHEGGFTQFSAVIPEGLITDNGNKITINVDNKLNKSQTIPLRNLVLYPKNYGGIFRDIYIIAVPKVFIRNINISNEIDINYDSDLKVQISVSSTDLNFIELPEDRTLYVNTEIIDSNNEVKASSGNTPVLINANSTVQVTNNLSISGIRYWSPDNPNLYKLRVRIIADSEHIIDEYEHDIGMLDLVQKSNSFQLNFNNFRFKGVNYIEEMMGYGIAMSYYDIENDVKNIKSLGFNAIRVYGRPASPYLIMLCNKYGLFILHELPLFLAPPDIIKNDNFIALAENRLIDIITYSKNNPCVFAYGFGAYLDNTSHFTKDYYSRMAEVAKNYDKRFVYYSTQNLKNDICKGTVNFVGLDIMESDSKYLKKIIDDPEIKKDKVFISGFGKTVNPSNVNGYSDPSSTEYQAKLIADVYQHVKNSQFLGSFFMSYSDWFSDYPKVNSLTDNNYLRTTGLYGSGREIRSPVNIMRKVNFEEDLPNFNIGTFSDDYPVIFIFTGIGVFLIFIYLANNIRRFRENIWRALFRPFIFFTDVREQGLISPWYNILLAVILSLGTSLFFSSLLYYWRDNVGMDIILSVLVSSETLKNYVIYLLKDPLYLTVALTIIVFIKLFIIAFIIWLFSLTLRFRIPFNNIYIVAVWGYLPALFFLIAGVFYYRLINENPEFVSVGLIIAASIIVITFYRIIKGTYQVFDSPLIKTFFYGFITIIVVLGGTWFYLNYTKYLVNYFDMIASFTNLQ